MVLVNSPLNDTKTIWHCIVYFGMGMAYRQGIGYIEDVTASELASCLLRKVNEKGGVGLVGMEDVVSETAHAITRHVHATTTRRQLALEWKV